MKNFVLSFCMCLVTFNSVLQGQEKQPTAVYDETIIKKPVEISESLKEDILELLELNGELQGRLTMLQNAIVLFKKRVPGVKDEFWAECDKLLTKEIVAEKLIPLYAKSFSHDEIKGIVAFFKSPLGTKFRKDFPQVLSECTMAINQFGQELGKTINAKLDEEGFSR